MNSGRDKMLDHSVPSNDASGTAIVDWILLDTQIVKWPQVSIDGILEIIYVGSSAKSWSEDASKLCVWLYQFST